MWGGFSDQDSEICEKKITRKCAESMHASKNRNILLDICYCGGRTEICYLEVMMIGIVRAIRCALDTPLRVSNGTESSVLCRLARNNPPPPRPREVHGTSAPDIRGVPPERATKRTVIPGALEHATF